MSIARHFNVESPNFKLRFCFISSYLEQKRTTVSLTKRYDVREYGRMHLKLQRIINSRSYSNINYWPERLVSAVSANKCDGKEENICFL